jgi:hypothetical protein
VAELQGLAGADEAGFGVVVAVVVAWKNVLLQQHIHVRSSTEKGSFLAKSSANLPKVVSAVMNARIV